MRRACPSLCKSFHITSNHIQSPPITTNHPPITPKLANQSPSNHLGCFMQNRVRINISGAPRCLFDDQLIYESSYFFTWRVLSFCSGNSRDYYPRELVALLLLLTFKMGAKTREFEMKVDYLRLCRASGNPAFI